MSTERRESMRRTLLECGYTREQLGISPEEAEAMREILREIALETFRDDEE